MGDKLRITLFACCCVLFSQSSIADGLDKLENDKLKNKQSKIDPLERGLNAYYKGDYKTAYNYTIPLASDGNPSALNLLGMMYELGQGVSMDTGKSVVLYRQAADKGDLYAQYNLAVSYDAGNGLPQNFREAVKWYRLAAEQGASFAQYNLAMMYEQGRGTEKSYKNAAKWYKKASRQGYSKAQNNLAYLYESGKGVKKDLVTAYLLFNKAYEQGVEPAFYKREELKHRMSKKELKQAKMDSQAFKTKNEKNGERVK